MQTEQHFPEKPPVLSKEEEIALYKARGREITDPVQKLYNFYDIIAAEMSLMVAAMIDAEKQAADMLMADIDIRKGQQDPLATEEAQAYAEEMKTFVAYIHAQMQKLDLREDKDIVWRKRGYDPKDYYRFECHNRLNDAIRIQSLVEGRLIAWRIIEVRDEGVEDILEGELIEQLRADLAKAHAPQKVEDDGGREG